MLKTTSLHVIVTDRRTGVNKYSPWQISISEYQTGTFSSLISPYGDMEHQNHHLLYWLPRDGHGLLACRLAALTESGTYRMQSGYEHFTTANTDRMHEHTGCELSRGLGTTFRALSHC